MESKIKRKAPNISSSPSTDEDDLDNSRLENLPWCKCSQCIIFLETSLRECVFFLFFFYQEQKYKTRQKLKKKEKTLYKDSTPYLYLNSSKGRADEDNIRKEKYLEISYNKI